MRFSSIRNVRVPVVLASCLAGALMSVACGEADPDGKAGAGLAGSSGKGGSIGTGGTTGSGKGGTGGTIGSGKGGTAGTIDVGSGGTSGSSSGTSGSSGLTDGEACVSISRDSAKTEVALLFMVDISGSMNCPIPELDPPCEVDPNMDYATTRWSQMKPALKDFFDHTSGMLAGINFFSKNNNSCSTRDYETPEAEIAMLPGAKASLDQAVDDQTPAGMTPTLPSLQGALNHADAWAAAHADQSVVVVYATDGYPKGCDSDNTIDNAAAAADKAYNGTHNIRTYVIGVGPNLGDLNKIAASGGTDMAFQLDTSQMDLTAQLTARFNEIRSQVAIDCQYSVPMPPAGQTLDPNKVNVNYTSGSGDATAVPFDDTGTCKEGWKYADDTKQQIVLCGSTCDTVKADPGASIQVAFGCTTIKIGDPR